MVKGEGDGRIKCQLVEVEVHYGHIVVMLPISSEREIKRVMIFQNQTLILSTKMK